MKLNQDFPIRMLRPVPRSPITFVQQYKGLSTHLEGEAFGYRNSGLFSSIVARMLRPYIYKIAIAFSVVVSALAKRSR